MTIGKLSTTPDSSLVPSATFSARTFRKMHEQLCKVSQTRVPKRGRERGETSLAKLWDSGWSGFQVHERPGEPGTAEPEETSLKRRRAGFRDLPVKVHRFDDEEERVVAWPCNLLLLCVSIVGHVTFVKIRFLNDGSLVRCIIDRLTCWQGKMETDSSLVFQYDINIFVDFCSFFFFFKS